MGRVEYELLRALASGPTGHLEQDFQGIFRADEIDAARSRFRELGFLDASFLSHNAAVADNHYDSHRHSLSWRLVGVLLLALVGIVAAQFLAAWEMPARVRPFGLLLLILVSACAHEGGHVLAAWAFGRRIDRYWFGLVGCIPVLQIRLRGFWGLPRLQRLVVTAAGPGTQITLAMVCLCVSVLWSLTVGSSPEGLLGFAVLNILLAAVNLLPFHPFDGYWLLAQWLDRPYLKDESKLHARARSVVLLALNVALGVWMVRLLVLLL